MFSTLFAASNVITGSIATILLIALIAVVLLVGIWLLTRAFAYKQQINDVIIGLSIAKLMVYLITIGTLLRVLFSLFIKGDRGIYSSLTNASDYYQSNGVSGYYSSEIGLYPIMYYLTALLGIIGGGNSGSVFTQFLFRLPFIVADIGTAVVLYKIGKKYVNAKVGAIVSSLFFLNPLFVYNSSIAGSMSSIVIFLLLSALYLLINKKYFGFITIFFIALLVDKSAIYFTPPIVIYSLYLCFKSIKRCKSLGMQGMISDSERSAILVIPLCTIIGLVLSSLIAQPLMDSTSKDNFFNFYSQMWLSNFTDIKFFGENSLNIYNIFTRNGLQLGTAFPALLFSIIFFVIACAITLALYLVKKNRASLLLIMLFVVTTIVTYYVDINAYALTPVAALLLLCFLLIRDKRILKLFAIYSFIIFTNGIVGIINSGSFSNSISESSPLYLDSGFGMAVNIICTVIAVITHIYFTIIVLDICISNRIKHFDVDINGQFGTSILKFAK